MSIGNVKTTGSKGTNWPWQYAMIKTLNSISSSLGASTEFESRLVRLIASPYTLYLEVRLWDVDSNDWSGTPKYYEVGSNTPVTPPSAVQYADEDNALVLDAIKTATQTTATETTSIDTNTAGILADTAAIDTATAAINTSTSSASNTAFMDRLTGTGTTTITQAVKSISVYNAHASATATINIGGAGNENLLAGETVNFDAGGNANKFPASHFVLSSGDASGDLLVIYVY
jgi:hypothetical protein